MTPKRVQFICLLATLALIVGLAGAARAQTSALSGTVTGPSGQIVPHAKVSVKNVATGQSTQAESDAAGVYKVSDLSPGKYEISVEADGFSTSMQSVTLTAGASQTLNVALSSGLSLQSLGFPQSQTQGNALEQARLDKRSHMLKIHQKLGLITAAPMLATIITGSFAGGKRNVTSSTDRDLHVGLGSLTAGMYFTTAYFAIAAPKIKGTKTRGPIRLHKALAWIHGPGMVLTPILGALAYSQKSKGERVRGIASAHGPVAVVTAAAYGLALMSVSIKF
ncbi:MAG TPA: carboxypeptidase-like regulatory domain-containing protein [Terriglobales bacterium]|nr:carboxypeptidase-like regulatory domain-containing protein [Terriglobales bacterium]